MWLISGYDVTISNHLCPILQSMAVSCMLMPTGNFVDFSCHQVKLSELPQRVVFCPLTYKIARHKADCQKEESTYLAEFNCMLALLIIWQYTKLYKYSVK